jgi:hypothetical protein
MYEEIDTFFGTPDASGVVADKKGRLFTSLNYKGSKYDQSINSKENPDTIKNEPIYQLMLANNYTTDATAKDNVISSQFIDFVKAVAARHIELDGKLQSKAVTKADVLSDIYGKWPSLSLDARDFYSQLINLVDMSATNQPTTNEPLQGNSMAGYRLNLKKINLDNTGSETIFGSTLPYLPRGSVDKTGTALPVDYLHVIYDQELRVAGRRAFVGGAAKDLSLESWEKVNLDVAKFVRAIAYVQQKSIQSPSSVKGELGEIYDLSTDKIYSLNASGVLVNASGEVMDETKYGLDVAANCHGTHLPDCELVFECLLSGDPKALSRCLGKLTVQSMYSVAKAEVAKMNPKVMKKVLSTFDVGVNKHGKVEEYIEWRGSLESRLSQKLGSERGARTAKAIIGNVKLLEYLKNVMDIIRSNPILTEGNAATLSDLPLKTNNKIAYFIKPTNINRAAALSTQLGTLIQQLSVVPTNLTAALKGPMSTSNTMFGSPVLGMGMAGLGMGGLMSGGGCVEDSVATMEAIYKQILEEMKRNGKDLVDEDKKRIENAIAQIKKNNSQLASALNDLKGFMRLNTAITAGLTSVSLSDVKGSSNADFSNQIKSFESSINSTANSQVSLMTALLEQVFRPMALIASGSSTTLLRPIN